MAKSIAAMAMRGVVQWPTAARNKIAGVSVITPIDIVKIR
jgi:hypothetical protein